MRAFLPFFKTAVLLLLMCLTSPQAGIADTIIVPDHFLTIQAAVNAATDGDSILVRPGTYIENILVEAKSLSIASLGGAETTIIDGSAPTRPDTLSVLAAIGAEELFIDGFTIRNSLGGSTFGFGSKDDSGGGVAMLASGGAITNCIIEDNFCDGDGGGLYLLVSSPSIEGCIVRRNVCGSDGGGVFIQSASPHLTGCMIADNECDIRGGGIAVSGGSPVIEGCLVSGNTGAFGSGISSLQFSSPRILSTVIVENGPREGRKGLGGGIYAGTGAPQIESCTIVGNENDLGGGIFFYDSSGAELSRSIVAFNRRGSAMACAMTSPVVSCCDFFGNEDVDTICGMDQGGNFSLDPLLCADYSISDRSPCRAEASPPGCGLVGALDVGCAAAVEATTWGRIKARQGRR